MYLCSIITVLIRPLTPLEGVDMHLPARVCMRLACARSFLNFLFYFQSCMCGTWRPLTAPTQSTMFRCSIIALRTLSTASALVPVRKCMPLGPV